MLVRPCHIILKLKSDQNLAGIKDSIDKRNSSSLNHEIKNRNVQKIYEMQNLFTFI